MGMENVSIVNDVPAEMGRLSYGLKSVFQRGVAFNLITLYRGVLVFRVVLKYTTSTAVAAYLCLKK